MAYDSYSFQELQEFPNDSALRPATTASDVPLGEIAVAISTPPTPNSPESKMDATGAGEVNPTRSASAAKAEGPNTGRPQVIVRIRPSPSVEDNIFEVDPESKTLQIRVERETKSGDPRNPSRQPSHSFIYFPADNVLENSSQEDTFKVVAQEIVEKAMEGVPGIIVAVGPESSGKSFSLFGLNGRYKNRGIAARAMEKLFEIKELKAAETDFRFGLGIIEVRRERIRDLLTLSPNEINEVGDQGPKGMYVEEIDCIEHGLGLLLRALIGQKLIHKEPYELYHTIMYLEIVGLSPVSPELVQFRSRITFTEIASAPQRSDSSTPNDAISSLYNAQEGCAAQMNLRPEPGRFKLKPSSLPPRKCGNPGYTTGPLAESIAVRRDVFALEQIFLKANEMYRIRKYFTKLEELGLSMIASEKRKFSNSRNFRQSRLAHCLRDILDNGTEIRIVLHLRPNKSSLRASLEAMRFAERARLVPSNDEADWAKGKKPRTHEQILQEVISDIAPELMQVSNMESLNPEKMKAIQEQAVQYFENNIDSMKVCTKEKVKEMFENFRVLWNFLWELELNVTLRKAEEQMRTNVGGNQSMMFPDRKMSETQGKDFGGIGGTGQDDDDAHHNMAAKELQGKKSSKRIKKEKEKKKKKKEKKDSQEIKPVTPVEVPQSNSLTNLEGGEEEGLPKLQDEEGEEVVIPPPPTEPEFPIQSAEEQIPKVTVKEPEGSTGKDVPSAPPTAPETPMPGSARRSEFAGDQTAEQPSGRKSAVTAGGTDSTPTTRQSTSLKGQSTGFGDFKSVRDATGPTDNMSEEERIALAAKQEQIISDMFEEMKKAARRQAIHLLRAGIKKPQWMTLF